MRPNGGRPSQRFSLYEALDISRPTQPSFLGPASPNRSNPSVVGVAVGLQPQYLNDVTDQQQPTGVLRMKFGDKLRQLRHSRGLSQRVLAQRVGLNYTYLSKIENDRLDFSQSPSETTIRNLARALETDEDELLLMAEKIPDSIRKRIVERPEAFRQLAALDDQALDRVLAYASRTDEIGAVDVSSNRLRKR